MTAGELTRFEIIAAKLVDAVAPLLVDRVAGLVAERYGEVPPLLDAEGAARYLGVDTRTVRRLVHDGQLSALKLGEGPKARLRFDPDQLRRDLSHQDTMGVNGTGSTTNSAIPSGGANSPETPEPSEES